MAQYKKLSEYTVNVAPNDGDLVPLLIDNGNGNYENALMEYSSLKGAPGTNGSNGQGVPTGGTTGQVLQKVSGASFDTAWVTMTISKAAVGLGNVDNTSDLNKPVSTATQAAIDAAVLATKQALYPVGSIYTNATDNTNPGTLLGFGTWVAFGAGRVPTGFDGSDSDFNAAEKTGGSKTHTLTIAQMPVHAHQVGGGWGAGPANGGRWRTDLNSPANDWGNTAQQGGGAAHPIMQPYITVYMWKRTA